MKIRTGFVSNSSSSSFILVGFSVPRGSITREEFAEKMGIVEEWKQKCPNWDKEDYIYDNTFDDFMDDSEKGAPEQATLLGYGVDGLEYDEPTIDLAEALEWVEKVRTNLNIPKDTPAKIFGGSYRC